MLHQKFEPVSERMRAFSFPAPTGGASLKSVTESVTGDGTLCRSDVARRGLCSEVVGGKVLGGSKRLLRGVVEGASSRSGMALGSDAKAAEGGFPPYDPRAAGQAGCAVEIGGDSRRGVF